MKQKMIFGYLLIVTCLLTPVAHACPHIVSFPIPTDKVVAVGDLVTLNAAASCNKSCSFTYGWYNSIGDLVSTGSSYNVTRSTAGVTSIIVGAFSTLCSEAKKINITFVEVFSVESGSVTSTTNAPSVAETRVVAKSSTSGDTITITANPNPSGAWPTGKPTWTATGGVTLTSTANANQV